MKTTHLLAMVVAASQTLAALRAQEDGGMKAMDKREHRDLMPTHVMMQEMQATQDAEIDKLLAEMNAATGEEKVEALAAVVNKLFEQRKAMHAKMGALLDH
ncbi:MAG: hypothetical protein WA771_01330 [Chthoniobacterales bacterium]